METFKLRCFWAAFYGLLWIIFGRNVSLAILVMHVIVIPLAFRSSKRVRGRFLYLPYARPFLDHDRPEKFGLEGARNVNVKFESSVDKCSIELGVWHTLPKALVKKHRYLLSNGSKDEINNVIDEELRKTEFPVFLYLHGVLGTRALPQRVETCKFLQNLDAHVVSFDYRGFADSTNVTPIKIGMVEDSLAVYAWIRGLVGARKPVFVWGHSIGSGIAQRAFSKLEPYSHSLLNLKEPLPPPQGMVVEGGYSSNIDLTKEYVVAKLATWLPPLEKMLMGVMSSSEVRILPAAYAALLRKVPVLILHSKDDGVIPYHFAEKHLVTKNWPTGQNSGYSYLNSGDIAFLFTFSSFFTRFNSKPLLIFQSLHHKAQIR
ncbi:hypothetical protein ABMA27_010156 [Loxostege sticticalis]|uniref:AB hydrolase-1 domain-containing protein n=1 Tax=Loxostege sticticalis TaxID=481309 RepID=A0ABR3H4V7_LOXSC